MATHIQRMQYAILIGPDFRPAFYQTEDAYEAGCLPLEQDLAVRGIKRALGMSSSVLGRKCGVSARTVDGWASGKAMSPESMSALNRVLAEWYGQAYKGARPEQVIR